MSVLPDEARAARRTGVFYSLSAYALWGLFPIYFKAIAAPPLEFLAHRVVWSAMFLTLLLGVQGRLPGLMRAAASSPIVLRSLLSACLLAANWYIYIWAVAHGRVVDASLGYFITPLVSVSLGVLLFGEGMRKGQGFAIALAAAGVSWLTWQFGELPWVGLALAFTFGSYGAMRKTGVLGSLDGLTLEQVLLFPIAFGFLAWHAQRGDSGFFEAGGLQQALLASTGPISALPLGLFAAGARLIPLSLIGVLQYVSPTIQLVLGLVLWHEPFGPSKLVGYALIWIGLAVYGLEGILVARRRLGVEADELRRAAPASIR